MKFVKFFDLEFVLFSDIEGLVVESYGVFMLNGKYVKCVMFVIG